VSDSVVYPSRWWNKLSFPPPASPAAPHQSHLGFAASMVQSTRQVGQVLSLSLIHDDSISFTLSLFIAEDINPA
jgi:hypothetical protein